MLVVGYAGLCGGNVGVVGDGEGELALNFEIW